MSSDESFTIKEMFQRLEQKIDCIDATVNSIDVRLSRLEEKAKKSEDEIEKLRDKSNLWDGLNSVAVAVVGAVALFFKGGN